MKRWMGMLVVMGLWLVSASSAAAVGPKSYPYKVTATVGMVADIVRQVAGDKAQVTAIIGSGVDPHLYKATRTDVALLTRADMIFYSGLLLEGRMTDILQKLERIKPTIAVTASIDEKLLISPEDTPGHHDPHVWMDVSLWAIAVDVVVRELGKFDPANASYYEQNGKTLREAYTALHEYGRKVTATIPENGRVLVTSHDAFNYFGRAYGLKVLGVQGISTESEAGLRDINKLVDYIVSQKVRAVFVESSVNPKNIRAVIDGAKAQKHDVFIGGMLFSDAMGEQGTYEGTYIGMLDHNITLVTRALGGDAPERGMSEKLGHGHESKK